MALDNHKREITYRNVLAAIDLTPSKYDNYRFSNFYHWCELHAKKFGISLQLLIENKHAFNWYKTQWEYIVENQFYNEVSIYIDAGINFPKAYRDLLDSYPPIIEGYFPGSLLKIIKKSPKSIKDETAKGKK